ncbi:hypothetical protein CEXT_145891 [Caerostris extrusa]|uniref:Uncharacterized protein n=1 Tax=Caerostris extrusa TaxID=172846 RepID=A0AAV4SRB6_CAEEX|nr:hypothetical protein CEXT_145891 [Caerostris extrusa]
MDKPTKNFLKANISNTCFHSGKVVHFSELHPQLKPLNKHRFLEGGSQSQQSIRDGSKKIILWDTLFRICIRKQERPHAEFTFRGRSPPVFFFPKSWAGCQKSLFS